MKREIKSGKVFYDMCKELFWHKFCTCTMSLVHVHAELESFENGV